jgi:hypothetical protein
MSGNGERKVFKLNLAEVSRGSVAFGEIGEGEGVFVCAAKASEILKRVSGHKGVVWVEANLVPNPQKERRRQTPYALVSSGDIYSVAKEKQSKASMTTPAITESTPAAPPPQATDEPATPVPDEKAVEPAVPVEVPEVRPDQLVVPLGDGVYRVHGTLKTFLEMIIEVLGETKDDDPEIRKATAILSMQFGHSPEQLDGGMSHLRRKAMAKRLEAMVDFLLETAGTNFCHLLQAADAADTVADLAVAEYPEARVALAEFLGIQSQDDAVELALVEDTAADSVETVHLMRTSWTLSRFVWHAEAGSDSLASDGV